MARVIPETAATRIAESVRAIEEEFRVALGSPARVTDACAALRMDSDAWSREPAAALLETLAGVLTGQVDARARALFPLVEEIAARAPRPWRLLEPMLRVGAPDLRDRALDALRSAADAGRLRADADWIGRLAALVEDPASLLRDRPALEKIARTIGESATALYVESPDLATRRLAARVLDLHERPPASALASQVIGPSAYGLLAPYLEFTRATHLDLLAICPRMGDEPDIVKSFSEAERRCGPDLLRAAIASVGWGAVNRGLEVRRVAGVALGGAFPLLLSPGEATLFDGWPDAEHVFDRTLIVAHGAPADTAAAPSSDPRVARFRACNVAHARVLAEFLDVAPLTRDRVSRLLEAVRALVDDFVALFGAEGDEAARVLSVYADLRRRITAAMGPDNGGSVPSEAVRLVQPFEDPTSPEMVRTIHGLKRYLHQRGLRLAFRLVQSGRDATRTVSLIVGSGGRVAQVARCIDYADFEPDVLSRTAAPYGVRVVVEGFARQLLHGEDRLPSVRVFCYGNEVHYFVSFRNHPAFVRVDYSPPQAGGMIDLEYYGVSKYELSNHPSLALEGVQAFFRRLDFDIRVDITRIHARYDKERGRDLNDLCTRAEALFRLLPYLMDIDWVIGGLDLPVDARHAVAHAWAEFFAQWGVLPLNQLLSADRRAIALREERHPAGSRETVWRGTTPYADRFTVEARPTAAAWLEDALRARGLAPITGGCSGLSQLELESSVLGRIREAIARGEIAEGDDEIQAAPRDRFERLHEAGWLAALLTKGGPRLTEAAKVGRVVASIERLLRFESTGAVNGHDVQRARLALAGEWLTLLVLRDDEGVPRVASFFAGDVLYQSRAGARDEWKDNASCDSRSLAAILRSRNFLATGGVEEDGEVDVHAVLGMFRRRGRGFAPCNETERIVSGLRASPGRAVGLARFGSERRMPRDLDGAILVADRLSPEDGPFLLRSSGVVCTGGGVLSHAGLLAAEFSRPALLIDAEWRLGAGSSPTLRYVAREYDDTARRVGPYEVVERRCLASHDAFIRDGDLIDLDADEHLVRVLGQDRETLALHDALRQLAAAEARLADSTDVERVLIERGRRIRARHQLERLLPQIGRPDLQLHAVRHLLAPCAAPAERAELLRVVLAGPRGEAVRRRVVDLLRSLRARCETARQMVLTRTPLSSDRFELLALRLRLLREEATLAAAMAVLAACPTGEAGAVEKSEKWDDTSLDAEVVKRFAAIADRHAEALDEALASGAWTRVRHLATALERDATVLSTSRRWSGTVLDVQACLAARDARARAERRGAVVFSSDVGIELHPLTGAKAANLGELTRLDPDAAVPSWFAVTDAAFRRALALPVPQAEPVVRAGSRMGDAIAAIVDQAGVDDRQRARAIAGLWDRLELPSDLADEIGAAYRALEAAAGVESATRDRNGRLLVAVRSSSVEEDAPEATRAGAFDTFLFISGEGELLTHVRRAWSGFWSPRALHNRTVMGLGGGRPGGGVLVQQIVEARAAGVLQTVNTADAQPREMVVNAAFGLGSGVVSGIVAADHVTIRKDRRRGAPLRFRYAIADKRQRVVFDVRRGAGTVVCDTLYHQRMRPALEYTELEELVEVASRLEQRWQQALDIEFAFDAHRLWLLQARPVPAFHAAWRDTARRYPFAWRNES